MGGFANNAPIVTDGLVFYVDAGNSKSYDGVSGGTTWTDLVGGNDGTLTNMDTNPASGGYVYDSANSGGIVFDGTNDYVGFGNQPEFQFSNAFTIDVWFKQADLGNQPMVCKRTTYQSNASYFFGVGPSNTLRGVVSTSGSNYDIHDASTTISSTSPVHGVFVYDNSAGINKLYVNGSQDGSKSPPGSLYNSSEELRIATDNSGGAYNNFNAYSVKMYNRALTSAEILKNYNALKNRFV